MRTLLANLGLLMIVTATGCGGAEVKRVTGQVLLEGEPLNKVSVFFWPKYDPSLGIMVQYKTDDNGGFDISPNPDMGEGKAGVYQVGIGDPEAKGLVLGMIMAGIKDIKIPGRRLPPAKYWQAESSPLEVRVQPGVNDLDPFELAD